MMKRRQLFVSMDKELKYRLPTVKLLSFKPWIDNFFIKDENCFGKFTVQLAVICPEVWFNLHARRLPGRAVSHGTKWFPSITIKMKKLRNVVVKWQVIRGSLGRRWKLDLFRREMLVTLFPPSVLLN